MRIIIRLYAFLEIKKMKKYWIYIIALLISILIIGGPIVLIFFDVFQISDSLDLLKILISWPIAAIILGLFFMSNFRTSIETFLINIGSMKLPGGLEIQRQDQPNPIKDNKKLDDAILSEDTHAMNEIESTLDEISQDENITEAEVQQLKYQYQQTAYTARWWKFAYLNLFFVPQTKKVLSWFANNPPQTRQSYNTLWLPYIIDQNQRNIILSVLLQNEMLLEENSQIKIAPEGFSFLQYIGSIPFAPPQQDI